MTRENIEKKIKHVKERKFYLAMKDRWSFADYQLNDELNKQLKKLKEELKNV